MALMLTREGVMSRLGGYRSSARGLLGRADTALRGNSKIVRTSEIVLGSFAFGTLQGRWKDKGGLTLLGLPVDLLSGTALHIFGLFPFARGYAHHLANLGDAALASFFTTTGYRVGERWAKGGVKGLIEGAFGDDAAKPMTGGSSIADREIANLVRAD